MNDPLIPVGDGHSALNDEDLEGLIPTYISTRGELFEAEQRSISMGLRGRRPPRPDELLDDLYLRQLHRVILRSVWKWAGQYRLRESSIGIAPEQIPTAVRALVDDVKAWIEYDTSPRDEIAVRFHHQLIAIHPFPNGNGRHGRIAADYLIEGLGGERFSWGASLEVSTDELRARYRDALQAADRGDFQPLLAFARS